MVLRWSVLEGFINGCSLPLHPLPAGRIIPRSGHLWRVPSHWSPYIARIQHLAALRPAECTWLRGCSLETRFTCQVHTESRHAWFSWKLLRVVVDPHFKPFALCTTPGTNGSHAAAGHPAQQRQVACCSISASAPATKPVVGAQ